MSVYQFLMMDGSLDMIEERWIAQYAEARFRDGKRVA
jgi:hypothetical protein